MDKSVLTTKISLIAFLSIFLSACGLINTEQAQEVLDIKKQVLEMQMTQVEPLIDRIDELGLLIDPLEREIEELEQLREDLYDQARELSEEFEREMRDRYEIIFDNEDDAMDEFENQIEEEFKALEQEWREMERDHEEVRGAAEGEQRGLWEAFESEQRNLWETAETESEQLRRNFEDDIYAKQEEVEAGAEIFEEQNDELEADMKVLRAASNVINSMQLDLNMANMNSKKRVWILKIKCSLFGSKWKNYGKVRTTFGRMKTRVPPTRIYRNNFTP